MKGPLRLHPTKLKVIAELLAESYDCVSPLKAEFKTTPKSLKEAPVGILFGCCQSMTIPRRKRNLKVLRNCWIGPPGNWHVQRSTSQSKIRWVSYSMQISYGGWNRTRFASSFHHLTQSMFRTLSSHSSISTIITQS